MNLVEEYILKQPQHFQDIMLYVIKVVEKELKQSELLFKWGIPYFYYKKKPFLYLAPNKNGFVDLGFARGYQLQKNLEVLIGEKRNTVKSLRYSSLEEINHKILVSVIQEAMTLYK